jgi:hypothetical protein
MTVAYRDIALLPRQAAAISYPPAYPAEGWVLVGTIKKWGWQNMHSSTNFLTQWRSRAMHAQGGGVL